MFKHFVLLYVLVSAHVPKHVREYEKGPTKKLVCEFIILRLI